MLLALVIFIVATLLVVHPKEKFCALVILKDGKPWEDVTENVLHDLQPFSSFTAQCVNSPTPPGI